LRRYLLDWEGREWVGREMDAGKQKRTTGKVEKVLACY
jgi:hypothetical protein